MNRDGYTEAYSKYFTLVYNTVYTKVSNADEAEDLCQEIFLAFFNKFEEIDNHRKWLNTTIRNVVMNHYRKRKPETDIDEIFNDVSLTFVNGFRDARVTIEEAIEASIDSEEDRLLIDMIAYHNYSYEHVARVTGFTRRKVEYHYEKIVQTIIGYLRKKGINNLEDLL